MSSIIKGYNYDIFISYRQKKKEVKNGGKEEKRSPALRGRLHGTVARSLKLKAEIMHNPFCNNPANGA